MRTSILGSLLLLIPCLLWANGGEVKDSLTYSNSNKTTQFKVKQLILPASLIAVGSWGVCNGFLQSVNHSVQDGMTNLRGDHYFHADDYIQYLPVVSYVGLGLVGVKAKHSFKERLIVTATSYLTLYNNRHWLNDVLAGAGFGILSARIGYWLLPINKRLFKLDKKDTAIVSAAPFYYPAEHVIGGALAVRF